MERGRWTPWLKNRAFPQNGDDPLLRRRTRLLLGQRHGPHLLIKVRLRGVIVVLTMVTHSTLMSLSTLVSVTSVLFACNGHLCPLLFCIWVTMPLPSWSVLPVSIMYLKFTFSMKHWDSSIWLYVNFQRIITCRPLMCSFLIVRYRISFHNPTNGCCPLLYARWISSLFTKQSKAE